MNAVYIFNGKEKKITYLTFPFLGSGSPNSKQNISHQNSKTQREKFQNETEIFKNLHLNQSKLGETLEADFFPPISTVF